MRRIKFTTGEYYHVYNRGVEKRDIYLNHADFQRFISNIEEFNYISEFDSFTKHEIKSSYVALVSYCLMPNHFHFILQQQRENGVSKFIQRLATGYTMYFNKRYERSGVLFQGGFKAKHIENDQYLLHLTRYVHLNPLELFISDSNNSYLNSFLCYKWSSLPYYLDWDKRSPVNLKKEIVLNRFEYSEDFKRDIISHIDCDSTVLDGIKLD